MHHLSECCQCLVAALSLSFVAGKNGISPTAYKSTLQTPFGEKKPLRLTRKMICQVWPGTMRAACPVPPKHWHTPAQVNTTACISCIGCTHDHTCNISVPSDFPLRCVPQYCPNVSLYTRCFWSKTFKIALLQDVYFPAFGP